MTRKQKCRFCGEPGLRVCCECAGLAMDWHNEYLGISQRVIAGLELRKRMEGS